MIQNGPLYEPYCTSMQMFHVLLWCHDSSAYRSFLVRVGRSRATSLSKACSVMRYFLRKVPSRTERFACSLQSSCGRLIAGALTRGRSLTASDAPKIIIIAAIAIAQAAIRGAETAAMNFFRCAFCSWAVCRIFCTAAVKRWSAEMGPTTLDRPRASSFRSRLALVSSDTKHSIRPHLSRGQGLEHQLALCHNFQIKILTRILHNVFKLVNLKIHTSQDMRTSNV